MKLQASNEAQAVIDWNGLISPTRKLPERVKSWYNVELEGKSLTFCEECLHGENGFNDCPIKSEGRFCISYHSELLPEILTALEKGEIR